MTDSVTPKLDELIELVHSLNIKVDSWNNRLNVMEENLVALRDAVEEIKGDDPTVTPTA